MSQRKEKRKSKPVLILCLAAVWLMIAAGMHLFPAAAAATPAASAVPVSPASNQGGGGNGGQPNILLITIDTLRCDRVSAYSDRFIKTPNLDRLASKGILFNHAFAHNPMTLPSHVNILTGTTPLFHGIGNNTGFRLDKKFLTLAEYLHERGYRTAAYVGSFVLSKYFGLDQGFDSYVEPIEKDEFTAAEVLGPAANWINSQKQPWFCWVHVWDAHTPYEPPQPYAQRFKNDPYSGEVAYVDEQLGIFFSSLEKNKKLTSTLIVITGDHGESLGEHDEHEHGYFAYNSTLHIPLIVHGPGLGLPARKIDNNVCHTDIFPTICDIVTGGSSGSAGSSAAGKAAPPLLAHLQGHSLLSLMKTGSDKKRENESVRVIYFESKGPYLDKGWAPLEGYIQGERKFIDQPIKELYNIASDYDEKKNIISGERISTLLGTLRDTKGKLTGSDNQKSSAEIDPAVLQKLRTFGYLAGFKQDKKTVFTREDDLKVLLPIQNMLRKAAELVNRAQYQEALQLYNDVLKKRPDNVSSYVFISEIYAKTGRPGLGIETLQQGLKTKPGNLELKSRLGVMLTEVNQVDQGIEILKEVLAQEDVNPEAWNFLGVAYFKKGLHDKAIEAYTKAVKLDPKYDLPYNNLGTLYLTRFLENKDSRDHSQAIRYFQQAVAANPRQASAYNGLGAAYKFVNKKQEAIDAWRKALEYQPDFIDVYFNLGILLLETGQKEEARRCFTTCKEKYFTRLRDKDKAQLERLIAQTY